MDEIGGNIDIQQSGERGGEKGGEKVTEADVQRVREGEDKARQVAQQAKQSRKENGQLAAFLAFIMQNVNNDQIIEALYKVFFRTKNTQDNVFYLRKTINTKVIVGLFIPFFPEKYLEFGLNQFYDKIYDFNQQQPNFGHYIDYLKKLSNFYHDNIPLDKGDFLRFLAEVVIYFNLYKIENTNDAKEKAERGQLISKLDQSLYGVK